MWSKSALLIALSAVSSASSLELAKSGGGSPCPCGYAPKTFDFSNLTPGEYVDTIVANELRVTASGKGESFTPDGKARVFDSSDPQPDLDLGSPNQACPGGGGPGVGDAGEPGASGENCVALGNLLVVQRRDKDRPDDAEDGGILEFEVDITARLIINKIGILDTPNGQATKIEITNRAFPDAPYTFEAAGIGANGFQEIAVPKDAKVRFTSHLRIDMPADAGIAYLTFCEYVSDFALPGQEFRKLRHRAL